MNSNFKPNPCSFTCTEDPEEPEQPGADEEVCLLPDTEREITEADKAEAEKVLAEKRKLAEGEMS